MKRKKTYAEVQAAAQRRQWSEARQQAIAAGETRYHGKVCAKHPEREGERRVNNRCCVRCMREIVKAGHKRARNTPGSGRRAHDRRHVEKRRAPGHPRREKYLIDTRANMKRLREERKKAGTYSLHYQWSPGHPKYEEYLSKRAAKRAATNNPEAKA
jgi:hypothetical protein